MVPTGESEEGTRAQSSSKRRRPRRSGENVEEPEVSTKLSAPTLEKEISAPKSEDAKPVSKPEGFHTTGHKKTKAKASAPKEEPTEGRPTDEPMDEKARRRAELESFLGPTVRAPVEIPLSYTPNDRSIHPLLHIEVQQLDYAGPLDLLLYLIRRHDLDVLDIPIAFIVEKYLAMLEALEALEIDLAAEFLVLAAELTHIKSKMLLPAEKGVPVEDTAEEEDEGDPRAELVRRLLEYQKYRDAAAQLSTREQLGRDVFPRIPPAMEKAEDVDPGLKQVSVFRLVELMAKLLKDVPTHHEISYEHYSIGERIQYVSAFGEVHEGRFTVVSLMQEIRSRHELVVTFIALLEMAKMGFARIFSEVFHQRHDRLLGERGASKSLDLDLPSELLEADSPSPIPDEQPGEGVDTSSTPDSPTETTSDSPTETTSDSPTETTSDSPTEITSDSPTEITSDSPTEITSDSPTGITSDSPTEITSEALMAETEGDSASTNNARAEDRHDELSAAKREAEALAAMAAEAGSAESLGAQAIDYPSGTSQPEKVERENLEPLPEIWVELTDRRFQGDLVDDYR